MYISSPEEIEAERARNFPDSGNDKLKADALNALPRPILARMCGGGTWEVADIEVECALVRCFIGGPLQVFCFSEVMELTDADGVSHDPDDFWHE